MTALIDNQPKSALAARAIGLRYGNKPDALIEMLHDLQEELGHVPEAALPALANALNLSRAEVHGVVTFYHDFRRKPAGRHVIKVCRAEACQWYHRSAALFVELVAQGALRSDSHEEAEKARRAAEACGR